MIAKTCLDRARFQSAGVNRIVALAVIDQNVVSRDGDAVIARAGIHLGQAGQCVDGCAPVHWIEGVIPAQKIGIARRAVFQTRDLVGTAGKEIPIPGVVPFGDKGVIPVGSGNLLLRIVIGQIGCVIVIVVIQSVDNCGKGNPAEQDGHYR